MENFVRLIWDHYLTDGALGTECQAHADDYSMVNSGVQRDVL